VPPTLVVLVAMSIVAWTSGDVVWDYAGKLGGGERWTAMSQVMTAIGIGWGISWLPYASDYSRFVPRDTSRARLFWGAALGQFVPVLWLGVLGASIATTGTGADPAVIIVETFGGLSIPSCCWSSTARSRRTSSTSTRPRWRRWPSTSGSGGRC